MTTITMGSNGSIVLTSDLMTQANAARKLNISRARISRLVALGKLSKVEIDGVPFVLRSEVEKRTPHLLGG